MKRSMKRWVSGLLAAVMMIIGIGANTKTASAAESMTQSYVYDGYEVTFMVTSAWDGAFNAEVKIANTGDVTISDWVLEFDFDHEIQNMWNATVLKHTEDHYVVKNNDWNANIKPGEGVDFGMTVQCEGDITFPESFSFVMENESVTVQSYSAEFILYSDWGSGCNGAIILSNLTDESIHNWQLEFDYNREIVNISNAEIVSYEQGHYVIKNAEYNADIAGNTSVHIGIVAGEGAADERPENFTMQQTVVGDASTGTEGGSGETPKEEKPGVSDETPEEEEPKLSDEEKEAIIAERLKGVKYTEPAEEHIKYDEAADICYVDNQVLIVMREGVTLEEAEAYAAELGATVVGYIVLTGDYQLEFAEVKTLDELNALVEEISQNELVEDAMLHEFFEIGFCSIPNDPAWYEEGTPKEKWADEWDASFPAGYNWGLEAINAMGAWEYEGETVNVGIIDTMFDTEHEDLEFEHTWLNPENVSKDFTTKYEHGEKDASDYAHGTHVAGTIAATANNDIGITGVATNVKLYGVAVQGKYFKEDDKIIREGSLKFKYAVATLLFSECKVINISMGNKYTNTNTNLVEKEASRYEKFLAKFLDSGYDFLIVQAAGNDAADTSRVGLFANITEERIKNRVIIVGAIGLNTAIDVEYLPKFVQNAVVNENGKVFTGYHMYSMSNYGERVDICAPGEKVYSTLPGNVYSDLCQKKGEIKYWTGTSMATPHVTGTAALCFSVNPHLTGEQVKEIICSSATEKIKDYKHNYEYLLLDASAAVELASKTAGEAVEIEKTRFGLIKGQILISQKSSDRGEVVFSPMDVENGYIFAYRIDSETGTFDNNRVLVSALDIKGEYELIVSAGTYCIVAYLPNYIPKTYTSISVGYEEAILLDIILQAAPEEKSNNNVYGTIYDALNGNAVPGVNITVREGLRYGEEENEVPVNNASQEGDWTALTDNQGNYSLVLPTGYYTLELEKDGYILGYAAVLSIPDSKKQDAVITPLLGEGEYRIVLTWESTPDDLDAHLLVYKHNIFNSHVCYYDKVYEDGEIVARLDHDDTTGYGAETITVTMCVKDDRQFLYFVQDSINEFNFGSTALSMSGAKVAVYYENKLIKTYSVPLNAEGTVWYVFWIINGKLVDANWLR